MPKPWPWPDFEPSREFRMPPFMGIDYPGPETPAQSQGRRSHPIAVSAGAAAGALAALYALTRWWLR
jgi:hypothetical protein